MVTGDDFLTKITFGDCLKLLLSTLDISNSRLSKAINVDSSLVNRWINGKRVPPYNSNHVENISEFLSRNVYNTLQRQQIDNIYLDVCSSKEVDDNIREKIKSILLETQGYSIECNKRKSKEINLFDNVTSYSDLSSEDKVVFGTDSIFNTYIKLLDLAANQKSGKSDTVYITYNNLLFSEHLSYNDITEWVNTLHKVIKNGWNVILLIRSFANSVLTARFINSIISLVTTGRLKIYYVKNYDNTTIGDGLVVVPDIGVLSCFTDNSQPIVNCGLYIRSKSAITMFQKHFQGIIDKYAQPLVNIFTKRSEFSNYVVDSEDDIGNRFLYKYFFSILTLPEHLYLKLLERKNYNNATKIQSMEFYKKRLKSFLSYIQTYEYKDVYLSSSIKDLIKNHQFYLYNHDGVETVYMDTHEIIEYLENIISMLLKYDNYSIAFLPKNYYNSDLMESFSCIVKERTGVLFESETNFAKKENVQTSITEPTLVKAIYDYFIKLWDNIPPENKDKSEVISWLQQQVNILKH